MTDMYINGMSCISPQPTFDQGQFLRDVTSSADHRLCCIEPDYASYMDPKSSRRMGRLLKYGTTAGLQALRDADIDTPDAISTGTGLGLLDDSGRFLKSITEADEGVVSPTAFIQSTHNTVSSNIALMVGCRAHNNTFVHKAFSLESAITDAQMLMMENNLIRNVLVGAYDELTDYSYAVMQRLRLIRQGPISNLDLLRTAGSGTIAGEGAAFFVLSKTKSDKSYSRLLGNESLYRPKSPERLLAKINTFVGKCGKTLADIDIVLAGLCGDSDRDKMLHQLTHDYFSTQTIVGYKHLCGEYMTSSAFALWMAAMMTKTVSIPEVAILQDRSRIPRNVLIVNAYKNNYAFMLLTAV